MEIAPNIHRVENVRGSNVTLLTGQQMAVVDTGFPGNGETIVDYIKSIGRSPRDLRWIINTHYHFDHSGSTAELQQLTDAKVVAHTDEVDGEKDGRPLLRKGVEGERIPLWYRWLLQNWWAKARKTLAPSIPDTPVDEVVGHGATLPCLDGVLVIHTPGHTPGSMCLMVNGPRVLFVGDCAINNINRVSRPLMWDRGRRRELDASLRSLRELDAAIACFGHGPALTDDAMGKLRSLTDLPYDLPTWQIVLKNWRTLRKFYTNVARRQDGAQGG